MRRYRLRFLLQEFDLRGAEVVLGRSPECDVTLQDPLVSRRHARIRIAPEGARVVDLGSRNGVRINGRLIDREEPLADGDRVRLGTHELVFMVVDTVPREARTTGFLKVCAACGAPYPEEAKSCPHCGATEVHDDDTMSGVALEPKRSWTFQLLGEVIDRAIKTERSAEAERLLRRGIKEVDEQIAAGEHLEPTQVAMIATYALRLGRLQGGSEWVAYALELHQRERMVPSDAVIEELRTLDPGAFPDIRGVLEVFLTGLRARMDTLPPPELARLAEVERLLAR